MLLRSWFRPIPNDLIVHSVLVRNQALELVAQGLGDVEVSRRLGVPRTTVRDSRAPRYVPRTAREGSDCPRCWSGARPMCFTPADYCFLLGLYLGDGCISWMGRTYRLRISLDSKYPGIIDVGKRVLERCFFAEPHGVSLADGGSCTIIGVYCNHLPCLLPQHGPGKKHERPIVLDLCFAFSNRSTGLLDLFAGTCDALGLPHCHYPPRPEGDRVRVGMVRINRREPVARLVEHVGVKR